MRDHNCNTDDRALPIDRPCSACSEDPEMKYHLHCPPFRESVSGEPHEKKWWNGGPLPMVVDPKAMSEEYARALYKEPPRAEPPLKCAICGFGIYFDLGAWRHKATGDRACRSNPEDGIAQPFLGGSRPSAPTHTYVGNGEVPCFEFSRPLSDEIHAAPAPKSDLVDEALILYVNEWQDVDFLFSDRTLDAQKVCEFAAAFAAHLRGK